MWAHVNNYNVWEDDEMVIRYWWSEMSWMWDEMEMRWDEDEMGMRWRWDEFRWDGDEMHRHKNENLSWASMWY